MPGQRLDRYGLVTGNTRQGLHNGDVAAGGLETHEYADLPSVDGERQPSWS